MYVTGSTGTGKSTQVPKLTMYCLKMYDYKNELNLYSNNTFEFDQCSDFEHSVDNTSLPVFNSRYAELQSNLVSFRTDSKIDMGAYSTLFLKEEIITVDEYKKSLKSTHNHNNDDPVEVHNRKAVQCGIDPICAFRLEVGYDLVQHKEELTRLLTRIRRYYHHHYIDKQSLYFSKYATADQLLACNIDKGRAKGIEGVLLSQATRLRYIDTGLTIAARENSEYSSKPKTINSSDQFKSSVLYEDHISSMDNINNTVMLNNIGMLDIDNIGGVAQTASSIRSTRSIISDMAEGILQSQSVYKNNKQIKTSGISKAQKAYKMIKDSNLYIYDNFKSSMDAMFQKCTKLKASKEGLDAIFIDYIQLLGSMDTSNNVTRNESISKISRELKYMSIHFNVPVIGLSQLNRGPDDRSDKRPNMSDLRDSGALEQDADVIMMLYRDEVYHTNIEKHKHLAEIIVSKNRHGSIGVANAIFRGEVSLFLDANEVKQDNSYAANVIGGATDTSFNLNSTKPMATSLSNEASMYKSNSMSNSRIILSDDEDQLHQ